MIKKALKKLLIKLLTEERIQDVHPEFKRTYEDLQIKNNKLRNLKTFCDYKLWNLHIEEQEWQKQNEWKITELENKINSVLETDEERDLYKHYRKWEQHMGKIVFISSILDGFLEGSQFKNRVWFERGWKLSEDRNTIEKEDNLENRLVSPRDFKKNK